MKPQAKIGQIEYPDSLCSFVEKHGDQLITEQSVFDVNGYAVGIGTRVQIKRLCERCSVCGYHSQFNPSQKRIIGEGRHKLERVWETIFEWDDYSPESISLEQAWNGAKVNEQTP